MKLLVSAIVLCLLFALPCRADFVIESIDGPVTPKEIAAFKEQMLGVTFRGDNNHNNFVYGNGGDAAEALSDVYEITQDREILDLLIAVADKMLAGRNDPDKGVMIWTGQRDPIWPNDIAETKEFHGGTTEQGDVIAHIAAAAHHILLTKSIWNEKLPDGQTYLDRAKHYVTESDRTIDNFILKWLVDEHTNLYHFPTSDLYARLGEREARGLGKPVPWNQQFMLNGAFQRLAECHELLGDEPVRVKRYDAIVKASCDAFLANMVHYDVGGHDCVKWSYVTEGGALKHIEDSAHGGYDMHILRAYRSGRYGITREQIQPIANTVMYVIQKDGKFASRTDGGGTFGDSLRPTYLPMCEFVPDLWPIAAKANLKRATKDPVMAATLLWMKHERTKRQ
ncbi:MAG TPA: hypothetical protein VH518_10105 [Tepidisphaeraceae bacterium]|jgi:hypothetical protein